MVFAASLVQLALVVVAALLSRRAKAMAIVLGVAAFVGPAWIVGPRPLLRGLCALAGWVLCLRIIDVVRFGDRWPAWRRVLHAVSFVDTRALRRERPALDARALGRALLWAALATGAFFVAHSSMMLVRWASGLVFAYAAIETGYAMVVTVYRSIGFVTPRLHVMPIASLSVGELWGVRWARPISAWLRETCLLPIARRGHPTLGLFLGFVVSAIGHAYPIYVGAGAVMAGMMFAFFIAQGVVVIIETRLGVSRWSRPARRAWTVTIMVVSSPLFVEPALRVLGP